MRTRAEASRRGVTAILQSVIATHVSRSADGATDGVEPSSRLDTCMASSRAAFSGVLLRIRRSRF